MPKPVIKSLIKNEALLNARRAQLTATATDVFIRRGFRDVSVNEIANAAGIGIGSLYKYIRSKEDILYLVMDSIYGQLEDLLRSERAEAVTPEEALEHTCRRFLNAVRAVRRGVLLMYREYRYLPEAAQREFMEREERIVNVFVEIIQEGNDAGAFHCSDPKLAALDLLMAGHAMALKGWMVGNGGFDHYIDTQTNLAMALVGANSYEASPAVARDDSHRFRPSGAADGVTYLD